MPKNHVKFHSSDGKRHVLVVEDELINQELLRMTLQNDYDLTFAATGAEAKAHLCEHAETLSLALLDLNLPDMNGLEILRWMRSDPKFSLVPVIVLTASQESEVESLHLGAADFIPKPYPLPQVIQARVLRTIELYEDREILRSTERDHLTGLYNQEFFYRYAEQFDQYHHDTPMDAIVVDVNHFHMINERYGKAYGDAVLCRIGDRLREVVQGTDGIVCRHEADTFFIYCPHRTDYADMLDRASAGLTDEAHKRTHVRLRMGVYAEVDKDIDIERRFDRARLAANTVRSSFTKGLAIYDKTLHESEMFEEHLLDCFHEALEEGQFVVYYQPKFDIRPSEPVLSSAEALVRWKNPELGMVSPGVFIPLFEKNGLIQELDSYVWRAVAAQLRDWKDRLGFSLPVSVNVSRVDMYDEDFVANLQALLREYGLTSDDINLEITESAYTGDSNQIIEIVRQLRAVGFKIEMDDFGSGYSSLNMVSTLPIDALKLDMLFIRNAFKGHRDTRMLEVVLEIADSLMVPSIAEGVETAEQMFALKSLGCDIVQGFYFSRPLPAAEYEAFLLARKELAEEQALVPGRRPTRPRRMFNKQFEYEHLHDPATGLYNKEAFDMLLQDGDKTNIALLLAGMRKGAGDMVKVRRAAEILRQSFRGVDFVCRVDEGKFAIIMTNVSKAMLRQVESKAWMINTRLTTEAGGSPDDALSFGVAFSERDHHNGTLIEAAEAALQSAPAGGCCRA